MAVGYAQDPPKQLNPFAGDPEAVKEGRRLYQFYGCPGCHGLMGGGGMGKPILDDEWIFGGDDETLYKLIKGQIAAADHAQDVCDAFPTSTCGSCSRTSARSTREIPP